MSKKFVPILAFAILALAWPAIAETGPCPSSRADAGLPGVVAELEGRAVDLAPAEGPEVSEKSCTATATCHDGTVLQCSDPGTGTCTGVDSNCSYAGQRGYVKCGSNYTFCPPWSQYYCEDINAGLHGSICPERCVIRSDGSCGFCSPGGPGGMGCLCTE